MMQEPGEEKKEEEKMEEERDVEKEEEKKEKEREMEKEETQKEEEEEKGMRQDDELFEEAARVVGETSTAVAQLLGGLAKATPKQRVAALARKRALETCPKYLAALCRLEGAAEAAEEG